MYTEEFRLRGILSPRVGRPVRATQCLRHIAALSRHDDRPPVSGSLARWLAGDLSGELSGCLADGRASSPLSAERRWSSAVYGG
jgi:hypothetical protein